MINLFIKITEATGYGVWILIGIFVFWLFYKIIAFYFQKLKPTIDGHFNIDKNFDNFKKEMRKEIKKLQNSWEDFELEMRQSLEGKRKPALIRTSPIKLTDEGEKIIQESDGAATVDNPDNEKKILDLILSAPMPTNSYDAQQRTIEVFRDLRDDIMFSSLKDYAYHKGYTMEQLLHILAIYFRKRVLELLRFKEEDIDKKPD